MLKWRGNAFLYHVEKQMLKGSYCTVREMLRMSMLLLLWYNAMLQWFWYSYGRKKFKFVMLVIVLFYTGRFGNLPGEGDGEPAQSLEGVSGFAHSSRGITRLLLHRGIQLCGRTGKATHSLPDLYARALTMTWLFFVCFFYLQNK